MRRSGGAALLIALLAGDSLSAQRRGADVDPAGPERIVPAPSDFARILWLHRGPQRDARTFAALRELGFAAVHVSGKADPGMPQRFGFGYYHDQLLGKGELEIRAERWKSMRESFLQQRRGARPVRPACTSDLQLLGTLSRRLAQVLERSLPRGPLALSLADEPSLTRHANPLDLCFGPACLRAYREFLRGRFGSLAAVNVALGTRYTKWSEVEPFTTDQIRRRELGKGSLPVNLAPWALHREFMDAQWSNLIGRLLDQVRRVAPQVPVGITGLQQASAFGGHDYARQMPGQSFYEVYDIGGARDLAMCTAPRGAWQMATLFPLAGDQPQALVRAQLADMLAHGMAGVITWSLGDVLDAERQPTRFGRATRDALAWLRPVMPHFAGAELQRDSIWIRESQASVRAWWMLDSRRDGPIWVNRLSSYEARHSTSLAARESWLRIFEDLGMQAQLQPVTGLAAALRRGAPRLIVLPAMLALSAPVALELRRYVEAGGVLVADHSLGFYTQDLRLREAPVLDEFFGLRGRSLRPRDQLVAQGRVGSAGRLPVGTGAAERGLAGALADQQAGFSLQIEQERGRGRCYYLNLGVCEYAALRLDGSRVPAALDLRRRVRHLLRRVGLRAPVELRAAGMPTCLERMRLRGKQGEQLLAIRVNALSRPALLQSLAAKGPHRLHLRFSQPRRLIDLRLGKPSSAEPRMIHTLDFDPWSGTFLRLEEPR